MPSIFGNRTPKGHQRCLVSIPMLLSALVVVLLISLTITLGALWLIGVGNHGSAEPGATGGGRWFAAKRDRLTLCVDTVNVAASAGAMAKTETEGVLAELARDPTWPSFNKGFPTPLVDQGCPSPPAMYDPTGGHRPSPFPDSFANLMGRVVSDPSYYYIHVYVIPQEDMDRFGSKWRYSAEERVCEGDTCTPVTMGLYIGPKDLEDSQYLIGLVARVIGLRGTGP